MMLGQDATFVDILCHRAEEQPGSLAYRFLEMGETETERFTYLSLDYKAREIAAHLQSRCAFGERALLIYPPGLDFIAAFLGCLYAGVVAVPAYPPRRNQRLTRLQAIVADSQAAIALTTSELLSVLEELKSSESVKFDCLATDHSDYGLADAWIRPKLAQDTLAFLQYTSGSTGTPKGVMVSHGNLTCNSAMIASRFGNDHQLRGVIWLPPYHDMGLIGGILQSAFVGASVTLMEPVSFLQKPLRWLKVISRYKGTVSGGPNFAYDLCTQKITVEQLEELNLSSWQVAFTGAEPVQLETLRRFATKFEPCGFRWEAFYPCYGMAETTLIIAGGDRSKAPSVCTVENIALAENRIVPSPPDSETSQSIVGCGPAGPEMQAIIVEPTSTVPCQEGQVGEVWVSGKSVAQGYWNQPELSDQCFNARLAEDQSQCFLRTGDLGFIQGEELFITGRLKDVIIIYGRNHYPQDIERTVEQCHPALRPSAGAAFGVNVEQQERLVIVQEVERRYLRKLDVVEIAKSVQQAISDHHGLQVYALLLLRTASIPKTSSGKIQRHACRQGFLEETLSVVGRWDSEANSQSNPSVETDIQQPSHGFVLSTQSHLMQTDEQSLVVATTAWDTSETSAIRHWLITKIAEASGLKPQSIDPNRPLGEYGLSSVQAVGLSGELEALLGRRISSTAIYEYPTIEQLALFLASGEDAFQVSQARKMYTDSRTTEDIAVVGLGCRFPGGKTPEDFWELLAQGQDAITEVSVNRWNVEHFYSETPATPGKMNTRWGGFLENIEQFDAQFFGISPREAHWMDPQQRLVLEVCWEALEQAGIPPKSLAGTTAGVFLGISTSDYSWLTPSWQTINAYGGTGNALSIAANRLSYILDLHGPSLAIDTACSSSLVAVHQACQSLRNQESTLAIVGGVNLILTPHLTLTFSQAQMMASDGRCKTFDAGADGYVRGEGCGVVILKRLSDAVRDQDSILSVIRGSAVNQDGGSHGLTAPNRFAQQAVIGQALHNAGVNAADIGYVEAHGTGTPLGDPIEMSALKSVLAEGRQPHQLCWVGSVKTNIGHLEAAAGMAGLIKSILVLQKGEIPPLLHLKERNPHLDLEGTPLDIPTSLQFWPEGMDRYAGVSSFGFGGTNAHVVLQGPPGYQNPGQKKNSGLTLSRPGHVLAISARTHEALQDLIVRCWDYLEDKISFDAEVADFCFSLNTGRDHHEYRLAVVVNTFDQLKGRLKELVTPSKLFDTLSIASAAKHQVSPGVWIGQSAYTPPKIVFVFSELCADYGEIARTLYETQPIFRETLVRCDAIFQSYSEQSLLDGLLTPSADLISGAAYGQPIVFVVEYALAKLWCSWGIAPQGVSGCGLGEYVAACCAGVFSLEDALRLVIAREKLMHPYQGEAVEEMSPSLIGSLVLEFAEVAKTVTYYEPTLAVIAHDSEMSDLSAIVTADYWAHRIAQSVEWMPWSEGLQQQGYEILLEIGNSSVLRDTVTSRGATGVSGWLPSLGPSLSVWGTLLESLAYLYVHGVNVDWRGFDQNYPRQRLENLPTYPFQRQEYWVSTRGETYWQTGLTPGGLTAASEPPSELSEETVEGVVWRNSWNDESLIQAVVATGTFTPEQRQVLPQLISQLKTVLRSQYQEDQLAKQVMQWGYQIQWQPLPPEQWSSQTTDLNTQPKHWLIFSDKTGLGEAISKHLRQAGHVCTVVYAGYTYQCLDDHTYSLHPSVADQLAQLWSSLSATEIPPIEQIVHLWSLDTNATDTLTLTALEQAQQLGCASVLHLVQMLLRSQQQPLPKLWLITQRAQVTQVEDRDKLSVAQTPLWGVGRVLSLERPQLLGGMIDLDDTTEQQGERLLQLIEQPHHSEDQFAMRQDEFYVPRLVKQSLVAPPAQVSLQQDGTYLITGGLGFLGLHMADWLVRQGAQHLVLVGRRAANTDAKAAISQWEEKGVHVRVCQSDITQLESVKMVLKEIETSMPPLRGLIHAAGMAGFDPIENISWQDFMAVLSPKVQGTWLLHQLTQPYALDFWMNCSSIASVWGSKGQSHYSAANLFLDGFSHYRHSHGHPTLSINWGPWDQGGMIQEKERFLLEQMGVGLLQPSEADYVLDCLLSTEQLSHTPQTTIANIHWPRFKPLFEAEHRRRLMALIDIGSTPSRKITTPASSTLLTALQAAPVAERKDYLQDYLQKTVAEVLEINNAQPLGLDQGFFDMGMDSLMAMDLKARLEKDLQTQLPTTLAFETPNLRSLAKYITQEVLHWPLPQQEGSPTVMQTLVDTPLFDSPDAAQKLEEMSEDTLEDLIDRELEALTGEVL
ncbi:type I polyketide synthase [Leptothoe sp. EHU-05/26/07-4]